MMRGLTTTGATAAPRSLVAALCVVASLLLPAAAASTAHAGEAPSARELWETYPLRPPAPAEESQGGAGAGRESHGGAGTSPESQGGAGPSPNAPDPVPGERELDSETPDGATSAAPVVVLVLAGVALAGGAFFLLRTRRREAKAPPPPTSEPPAPDPDPQIAAGAGTASAPLWHATTLPPNPDRAWDAEVRWSHADQESRFSLVGHTRQGGADTIIAESAPVEWPPTSPASVEGMTQAVEALIESVMAAGWRPTSTGDAWYARRFVWDPATAAPEDPGERRPVSPRRFAREPSGERASAARAENDTNPRSS